MSAREKGITPIFIVLVICFFFLGFFLWNRNFSSFKFLSNIKPVPSPSSITASSASPSASPKSSLRETCLSELKSVPKPPFKYQKEDGPVGTLQPIYKKERFTGSKNIYSCYTSFMFNRVMDEAYADLGLQYHETDRFGNTYVRPGVPQAFEKAVYIRLSESFKSQRWELKSQYGEKYSLPVMLLTKTEGSRQYFIDITYSGSSGVAFSYVLTVMEK